MKSGLLTENNFGLHADLYEFTMGQADFESKNNAIASANYYIRSIPEGQYMVSAGLEQVIQYILNLKFSEEDLLFLQQKVGLKQAYINELANFNFKGDISAVPEGSIVFANEPIINITGRSRDIQLFETYLLCVMNFQTLIATKAARINSVAQGRRILDFGARRAHGRDASILAARAAFIGGCQGTSLVAASKEFDIPFSGTMAHKFILERESELQAFRDYAAAFPNTSSFLIDTYSTMKGIKNAIKVAYEMEKRNENLFAVRIDSGDLAELSHKVRNELDNAELNYVNIIASDNLNEFKVEDLIKKKAPIDIFGIGTHLVTGSTNSSKPSAMPGVFKLVETNNKPVIKKSNDDKSKATLPYLKQIWRIFANNEKYLIDRDIITKYKDKEPSIETNEFALPLLVPIIKKGKLVYNFPSLSDISFKTRFQLQFLPIKYTDLRSTTKFPIKIQLD